VEDSERIRATIDDIADLDERRSSPAPMTSGVDQPGGSGNVAPDRKIAVKIADSDDAPLWWRRRRRSCQRRRRRDHRSGSEANHPRHTQKHRQLPGQPAPMGRQDAPFVNKRAAFVECRRDSPAANFR
jgi:hypothetical protein